MTLTIALPCEVEASLASEAARAGLPIDEYVLQVLRDHTAPQTSKAIAVLQAWRDSAIEREQTEPENDLFESIDQHRLSSRPLFPPELKGVTW